MIECIQSLKEKEGGDDNIRFDDEVIAIIDENFEYQCFNLTHQKETFINFSPTKLFNLSQEKFIDRSIPNLDYLRYTSSASKLPIGENTQLFIDIPKENSDLF